MTASSLLSLPFGLFSRAVDVAASMKRAWIRRRLVGQMTGLDDHMLRDIGLSRADLDAALGVAGFADPTQHLALRAHETRANRRAVALEQRQWAAMVDTAGIAAETLLPRRAA